jgi:hypothetical protein
MEAWIEMRQTFPQPDLFEAPPPRMMLTPAERTKLVDHLRLLLMEAMTPPPLAAHTSDRSEVSDDKNHA